MSYEKQLRCALDAALEGGEILRREFHRWGGPRGQHAHAEADEEAEWVIRNRLLAVFPEYKYRGEETGSVPASDPHVWLVDPNDGTSAFLRGARGSSVSIGLVRNGIPVLGVVYAYCAPDDAGDLIHWAEGFELTRNGVPVHPNWDVSKRNQVVVLVTAHREPLMESVLTCIHPFRYRAFASIAYRLALAAVGDGAAGVSWHSPGDWDYAGGHALLRGAGGIFVDDRGQEVTYAADGSSKVKQCFGGEPGIVRDLVQRNWRRVQSQQYSKTESRSISLFDFARLKAGKAVASAGILSRAQGCLMGQVAGDALGQQVEFLDAASIRRQHPQAVTRMDDGGQWNTMAGQPTDDSELALLLGRSIHQEGSYVREKVAQAYSYWFHETAPFDVGTTIAGAMRAVSPEDVREQRAAEKMSSTASRTSQANGSLMRISPLGIYCYRKSIDELWQLAEDESALTHSHPVCRQACALFVAAIALAVESGRSAQQIYEIILDLAQKREVESPLLEALRQAGSAPPAFDQNSGWVLIAFQNAFYRLLHAESLEEAIVETVMEGGDTDTNAAIAGALLGAVHGREAIPHQWRQMVLSCRPHAAVGAEHPRPYCFWPVDLTNLAEVLLL